MAVDFVDWDSLSDEAQGLVFDILRRCHDKAIVPARENTETEDQALDMAQVEGWPYRKKV